jgi:hypothetical protein
MPFSIPCSLLLLPHLAHMLPETIITTTSFQA